jgi:hypothetical protein
MHTYAIILPPDRPHLSGLTSTEVSELCRQLGYDPRPILRKLNRSKRATLKDDLGAIHLVREA